MRVALNTADAHLLAVKLFQRQLPRGRTTHNPELLSLRIHNGVPLDYVNGKTRENLGREGLCQLNFPQSRDQCLGFLAVIARGVCHERFLGDC